MATAVCAAAETGAGAGVGADAATGAGVLAGTEAGAVAAAGVGAADAATGAACTGADDGISAPVCANAPADALNIHKARQMRTDRSPRSQALIIINYRRHRATEGSIWQPYAYTVNML